MNKYHVIYIEAGTLERKYTSTVADSAPHAIYLTKLKIGDKWETLADCYLMERGGESCGTT